MYSLWKVIGQKFCKVKFFYNLINLNERNTMDWLQFLQIVCVPAFVWLVHKYGEMRKDLNDFKVQVAKEYATQVHINRLELKIDDLRQLRQ